MTRFLPITKQFHTESRQRRRGFPELSQCCVIWRSFSRNCFSSNKMTFKSLMNFGSFGKAPWDISVERYHDGGHSHGGYHGGSSKGKGGSGAALSALTLLAFLFLLNVMQQSLQDNNSTITAPTTTAFLLRETDQLPVALDGQEDGKKDNFAHTTNTYESRTSTTDYVRVRYED